MNNKLVSPTLMWLIVLVGIILSIVFAPSGRIISKNMFTPFLIFPVLILWAYLHHQALKAHPQAPRSLAKIDKVITTGIYSRLRYPIYLADISLACGIFFVFPFIKTLFAVL